MLYEVNIKVTAYIYRFILDPERKTPADIRHSETKNEPLNNISINPTIIKTLKVDENNINGTELFRGTC